MLSPRQDVVVGAGVEHGLPSVRADGSSPPGKDAAAEDRPKQLEQGGLSGVVVGDCDRLTDGRPPCQGGSCDGVSPA